MVAFMGGGHAPLQHGFRRDGIFALADVACLDIACLGVRAQSSRFCPGPVQILHVRTEYRSARARLQQYSVARGKGLQLRLPTGEPMPCMDLREAGCSGTLRPLLSEECRSTSPPRQVLHIRLQERKPQSSLIGLTALRLRTTSHCASQARHLTIVRLRA